MTSSATCGALAKPGVGPDARRSWLAATVLLVACALTAACGTPAPKPTRVEGSIAASSGLNPSVNNRPSPVLLRIYELRSATSFNQADFMSLYQSDQATLAADLVAREEMMLQPGEVKPFNKQLAPETRFIGVIGAYRNLERATWRAVVPVSPNKTHKLNVRAGDLALSATLVP